MKKTAIAIAVALAGFATVAQAAPKDNTWYTGAKLGWSQYHDTGFINNNGPTHENQLGAGAFGGYQVNPYVGFEMGYDWLGRMPYKGSVENGAYKAQGVQLTAKLGYPITDDLDIYTRLGGMVWRADTKSNVYGKNQGLSERRAQSVVDYLISKGIPADKISARGMGESNPVTGNTCDNVKQRAALIDCLAPDRRVEIEVKGIKDVVTQPQA